MPTPQRRGRRWVRLDHGVQIPASAVDPFWAGLQAWDESLKGRAIFTALTAARAHGMRLPPVPADLPVFAVGPPNRAGTERVGCRLRRERIRPAYELLHGVRVATPVEALLACAREVSLLDLVVLLDGALHRNLATGDEIRAIAASTRHGAPALRRALGWTAESESPWETLLRVLHVCAQVRVAPQHAVYDGAGVFVARGDLWLRGTQILHEYDGEDHRTARGQRRDLSRDRRLLDAGWRRRGYVAYDISSRPGDVILDARRAVGLDFDLTHVETWLNLWNASLFSPLGTYSARARWGLP